MDFPILIIWMSLLLCLGASVVFFHLNFIFDEIHVFIKQTFCGVTPGAILFSWAYVVDIGIKRTPGLYWLTENNFENTIA